MVGEAQERKKKRPRCMYAKINEFFQTGLDIKKDVHKPKNQIYAIGDANLMSK